MSETLLPYPESLRKRTNATAQVIVTMTWLLVCFWTWYQLGPTWAAAMRPNPDQVIDFYQEWGSARNYWSGLPIYTPHSVSIPRYLGLASNPEPRIEYNIHPPTSVLLALPLGRLNYRDAVFVWNVISLASLLASAAIIATVLPGTRSLLLPGLAVLPLCHPVYGNLYQGQLNLILVLLVTAMWALERSGRFRSAGLLLGLATAIKLFPAYLAVLYLARARGRLLMTTLTSLTVLTLITALVLGLDTYHDYIAIVLPWNAEFRISGYNLSFAGFWHSLFYPAPGEKFVPLWDSRALARWGTVLSNLVITAIVAARAYQARTLTERDLAFAITAIGMLLVSPVTWDKSLPILLAPFILIGRSPAITRSSGMSAAFLIILVIDFTYLLILTKIISGTRPVSDYSWTFMLGAPSLKFYALLATFFLGLSAYRFEAAKSHRKITAADGAT